MFGKKKENGAQEKQNPVVEALKPVLGGIGKAVYIGLILLFILIALQFAPKEHIEWVTNLILKIVEKMPF